MSYKSLVTTFIQKALLSVNLVTWESKITIAIIISFILIFWFNIVKSLDCDLSLRINEILFNFKLKQINFKERVIWITGASSGIGEHLAYELATHGAKLVLCGRNIERLEKVKQNCKSRGCSDNDLLTITFDLKDRKAHRSAIESVLQRFGKVDIFVNNAGTSQRSRFELIESRVDQDLFENNVFGGVSLTRLILKHWYDENLKGHIVVTSSIVGKAALPECASYAASKHALHGYYECLRYEAANKGIVITMVCSGPVKTGIAAVSYTGTYGVVLAGSVTSNRMSPKRHAELMVCAIGAKLEEVCISIQPFLWYCYAHQYFPTLSKRWLIKMANRLSQSRDH